MKHTTGRIELRERHPDFKINQKNAIMDVLEGYSKGQREKKLPAFFSGFLQGELFTSGPDISNIYIFEPL